VGLWRFVSCHRYFQVTNWLKNRLLGKKKKLTFLLGKKKKARFLLSFWPF